MSFKLNRTKRPQQLSMSKLNYLWIIFILAILMAKQIKSIETTTATPVIQPKLMASTKTTCGGILTESRGIIQTPNFPNKFPIPITCVWIIDGSTITNQNISIIVYLTQQYVLSGLRFTEYMYYSEDYKVPTQNIIELKEDDVTKKTFLQFSSPYLEIKFHMNNLHGTHLRALDQLLDVYGFNITYEIDLVKKYQCNTLQCRFLGHCYATMDFT